MSIVSEHIGDLLNEVFSQYVIKEEYFVFFEGSKLFFDFYLPELFIAVEVQGDQHFRYTKHFHSDGEGFRVSKKRDRLKKEWADINNVRVVEFFSNDVNITKEGFVSRMVP